MMGNPFKIAIPSSGYGRADSTTFTTDTIPPDNFIWADIVTMTASDSITYLTATLSGYKIKGTFNDDPFNAPPAVLTNTDSTLGWWEVASANITTDGQDTVISQWNDMSGNDYHLVQATSVRQPKYAGDSVTFNGVDNFMSFSADEDSIPVKMYIVVRLNTMGGTIFDLSMNLHRHSFKCMVQINLIYLPVSVQSKILEAALMLRKAGFILSRLCLMEQILP
jgi:hypothetical protein